MNKIVLLLLSLVISGSTWANPQIEKAVRLFNQKEYQSAQKILQQESNKGSAYATYWLGVVQYKYRQHFEAGSTFLKAAEMGSPWAMAVMAGSELNVLSPCNYLGWPCDKKWREKALEGWKKQAEQNNGKAMYAYNIKL